MASSAASWPTVFRTSAAELLWEAPFWLVLAFVALAPGSRVPWWTWFGQPVRSPEALFAFAAVWYATGRLLTRGSPAQSGSSARVVACGAALFGWTAVSLAWNGLEGENFRAMALSLALSAAVFVLAVHLTQAMSDAELYRFLSRLTIALALISALYSAESVLQLGLRSEAGRNTGDAFGIERVRGPLYGAATGYFLLLPALGWTVQRLLTQRRSRRQLFALGALMVALMGLGSRAALILAGAYLVLLCGLIRSWRKRAAAVAAIVLLGAGASGLVFSQASAERLQSFEDSSRQRTHETVWRYFLDRDALDRMLGAGFGGIWTWYLADAQQGERLASGDNLVETRHGVTLYHSHSTVLLAIAELGLIGAALLAALILSLGRLGWTGSGRQHWQAASLAVIASLGGLLFDLFLFKNTTVNAVWWIYALGIARLAGRHP